MKVPVAFLAIGLLFQGTNAKPNVAPAPNYGAAPPGYGSSMTRSSTRQAPSYGGPKTTSHTSTARGHPPSPSYSQSSHKSASQSSLHTSKKGTKTTSSPKYTWTSTIRVVYNATTNYVPPGTDFEFVPTGTITSTISEPYTTVYVATSTTTRTTTAYVRPRSTLTVPTVSGFTPIRSEPPYSEELVVAYETQSIRDEAFIYASPTATSYYSGDAYTRAYVTFRNYTYTGSTVASTTKTVTLTSAVVSAYAACGTNNYVNHLPNGKKTTTGAVVFQNMTAVVADATNRYDCCVACNNAQKCAGGSYNPLQGCNIYILHSNVADQPDPVCDPTMQYGQFLGYDETPDDLLLEVFNGPCGQLWPDFVN